METKTARIGNDRVLYGINVVIKEKISKKDTPYTIAVFTDSDGNTLFTTVETSVVKSLLLQYYICGGG